MASSKSASPTSDNPKFPTITRAELAGGYFNKHVTFVIRTPAGAVIKRRYTDFEWLRHLLCTLYPGAFIPPIPPKLPVAMWPQGYLLMRKRELQQFLHRLEVIPYLKAEEVTIFFLTNHGGAFDKARKKWEKEHPRPSDKALFDKLVVTFPSIHETKTPSEMESLCSESNKLIDDSIKQLDVMVRSSEAFLDVGKECCDSITEFRNAFENLVRIEYDGLQLKSRAEPICTEKRVDISTYMEQWKTYKLDELNHMNLYYVPILNRALNDLRVIKEILTTRDKLQTDYKEAKRRADVWNGNDGKAVRSSDLAKKHRELQKEEDLANLRGFVEKLVLGQLNVVMCANTRRWKKTCHLFASKHVVSLEKMSGSWKDLANKILQDKGNTDGMFKSLPVDALDETDTAFNASDEPVDEEKVAMDEPVDEEGEKRRQHREAERKEQQRIEQRRRELEAEQKELEERRLKELKAEREKAEKEKQARMEEVRKQQQAAKDKMKDMFKDENQAEDEFPWDDE